ncbi:hypothetical protein K490DRAFT_65479 [Saccharata proteae CBS 121410]|uniref:Uncharacterized protein n=1 Tax=Saccharata proteae CBS 121410 TaxID=1314787 RepID=A0A9P4HTC7_9PEZI|nr:hypothetical protein K490DRAFT_65479 [Saccharata proteae CBS 121410]
MLFTKATIVALALALPALASPTLFKRTGSFDCCAAKDSCLKENTFPGAADFCNQEYDACTKCEETEDCCRSAAGNDYNAETACTVQAQQCYHSAFGMGSLASSPYDCAATRSTCQSAPEANQAFCASVNAACEGCENQEDSCRTAPNANQASCSAQVAGCYNNAITNNGTISPANSSCSSC